MVLLASWTFARVSWAQVSDSTRQQNTKAEAANLFELGISWVAQERYEDALEAFTLANRLAPHPDVTYNLALVQVELKLWEDARRSLLQYLNGPSRGWTLVPEATDLLRKVDQELSKAAAKSASLSPPPRVASPDPSSSTMQVFPKPTTPGHSDEQNLAAYVLLGTGAVLIGGAAAFWWWNHERMVEALAERGRLDASPPDRNITSSDQLHRVLAFERERARAQAQVDIASKLDWVAISSAALGAVAVGASIYLGFHAHDSVTIAAAGNQLKAEIVW